MLVGVGKLDPFLGILGREDEIYVLRISLSGMSMSVISEPLALVEAVGRVFASGIALGLGAMPYDVRGICLGTGGGDSWTVDVVCTFSNEGIDLIVPFKDGVAMARELNDDTKMKQQYPSFNVSAANWFVLTGAEVQSEIAYWLSAAILYDHRSGGKTTQAFDNAQNVWSGTAEHRITQWQVKAPPIGGQVPPKASSDNTWIWVGAGALALVGLWAYSKQARKKR